MTTIEQLDTRLTFTVHGAEPLRHGSTRIIPRSVEIIIPPAGEETWRVWLTVSGRILRLTDGGLSDRWGRIAYKDATNNPQWIADVADAPQWVLDLWVEHVELVRPLS